jgi:NACHT domain
MKNGRVLLMLDGLDETDPELRDHYVLPWLINLCQQYPKCRYLVSSRPVGYLPGVLKSLEFVECDLLDFGEPDIVEYTRHWCTAVRLARNEPEEEARREGAADGEHIVSGFKDHPYIRNLARNPLMLSAVCLVNYFEAGELPKDRAPLYRLCVEGLLHHWDQRRGIHSDFALDEKLRACREVALAMQADDRAEYETEKVKEIFTAVLGDDARAAKLLEQIAIGAASRGPQPALMRFLPDEVAPIANRLIGKIQSNHISESHHWLLDHPERIQPEILAKRLRKWRSMSPFQATELIHLLHASGPNTLLVEMAANTDMYTATGPSFDSGEAYNSQTEIALIGLSRR